MGSANVGHRSVIATKEMGVRITDCPTLGEDLGKVFDIYWRLDQLKKLPNK